MANRARIKRCLHLVGSSPSLYADNASCPRLLFLPNKNSSISKERCGFDSGRLLISENEMFLHRLVFDRRLFFHPHV